MKKIIIISLILLCIILLDIITRDNITTIEATRIGEEKYLLFLWMVDGAFNNDRYNEEYIVNDKKLDNKNKIFTCKYIDKIECIGNNFESEFKKLFSRNINYDKVYSDNQIYSWLSIKDNKYYFNNINTCNINRMSINQRLMVKSISEEKIVYEINIDNRIRDFILIYEDNDWKISNAFYHDLCGMKYFIY